MNSSVLIDKLKRRIRAEIVKWTINKSIYPFIYLSYWHSLLNSSKNFKGDINYFSAVPNPGAGIGHQLANWIAGYWFAKQFELHFAHIPFSTEKWENFLGFGENETTVKELVKNSGYKKVRLPLFDEDNIKGDSLIKKIIESYSNQKVVFITEQDQSYKDQFGVMEQIKQKFHCAKARQNDQLIYSNENFNIAIHIRRGDIVVGKQTNNLNLIMRWQDNNYFLNALSTVIENLKTEKPLAIYLFSQGKPNDFQEFDKFENFHYCLDMSATDSFVHMVFANLLITSKSSFSYKPALLSNGIKVCPRDFWHGYPINNQWILVENDGSISKSEIAKLKINDSNTNYLITLR